MRRYIIIGIGVSGISCAETLRSQDPESEITVISDDAYGFYSRPGLAYYLTGELNLEQLNPFSRRDFQSLRLRRLNACVERILPGEHRIELHGGKTVQYDRLLVATGAFATRSTLPGSEAAGVIKLDNLEDANRILKLARRRRTAVIVGGGITALEIVEGLRARGLKTHYLLRRERYWSNVLDEIESRIVERRLLEEGVKIHYHTDPVEIIARKGQVTGVRTKKGEVIKCDIVAIAIGITPRIELAKSSGINTDRGILVDEYMQTSSPDIFAAGDVAQVYDPFSGKSVLETLWGPAREQGRAAGFNMAGKKFPYNKSVAFNVTRLAGLTTTIVGSVGSAQQDDLLGIARGDSETWRQIPDAIAAQDNFEVNRLRIMVGRNALVGAIIMGDQTLSPVLHTLIAKKIDISPIREQLLRPYAPVADLITDYWIQIRQSPAIC